MFHYSLLPVLVSAYLLRILNEVVWRLIALVWRQWPGKRGTVATSAKHDQTGGRGGATSQESSSARGENGNIISVLMIRKNILLTSSYNYIFAWIILLIYLKFLALLYKNELYLYLYLYLHFSFDLFGWWTAHSYKLQSCKKGGVLYMDRVLLDLSWELVIARITSPISSF